MDSYSLRIVSEVFDLKFAVGVPMVVRAWSLVEQYPVQSGVDAMGSDHGVNEVRHELHRRQFLGLRFPHNGKTVIQMPAANSID